MNCQPSLQQRLVDPPNAVALERKAEVDARAQGLQKALGNLRVQAVALSTLLLWRWRPWPVRAGRACRAYGRQKHREARAAPWLPQTPPARRRAATRAR